MFTTIEKLEASSALSDRVTHLWTHIWALNPKFKKTDYIPLPLVGVFNGVSDMQWVADQWVADSSVLVETGFDKVIALNVDITAAFHADLDKKKIEIILKNYEILCYSPNDIEESEISPFINKPLNASNFPATTYAESLSAEAKPTTLVGRSIIIDEGQILTTSEGTIHQRPDLTKLSAADLETVFDRLHKHWHENSTFAMTSAATYPNSDGRIIYAFTPAVEPEIDFRQVGASYRASKADHADDEKNDRQSLDREFAESDPSDLDQDDDLDSGDHHNMHDD